MKIIEIIDEWFTSECENKCDPKTHMKVVGFEDIEELKSKIKMGEKSK